MADDRTLWDGWSPEMARSYVAHRVERPIALNGRMSDPQWAAVRWTDDFVDIQGDARPRPRYRTRAKICWDEAHLYIAAEMEEPHVWATLTRRDSVIFHDNDFEVFIDPDGDQCDYYELEINAVGTVWDLRLPRPYRDGGEAINEWDISGLRTAVHIDGTLNDPSDIDRGWSVEIAIPWRALAEFSHAPAPPRDGDQWRINFSRVQWHATPIPAGEAPLPQADPALASADAPILAPYRKVSGKPEDNWVWSPQGVIDMHRPERWGCVQFTNAPPGTPVPFTPDPLAHAKWYLQRVHEAQKLYRAAEGRWADDVAALSVPALPQVRLRRLIASREGYLLTVESAGATLERTATRGPVIV